MLFLSICFDKMVLNFTDNLLTESIYFATREKKLLLFAGGVEG